MRRPCLSNQGFLNKAMRFYADEARRLRPFAMAEFHPDAPAVLAPAGAFTSFVRRTPDPTLQLVRQSALARVRRGSGNSGSNYFDPSMVERLYEQLQAGTPMEEPEAPLHERVHAIEAPIVFCHGDRDRVVPRDWVLETYRLVPGARLVTFPGCGHNVHVEAPDEIAAIITQSMGESLGRTPGPR